MIKNEKCPCKNINCKIHGNCKECKEKHKDKLTACQSGKMFVIR